MRLELNNFTRQSARARFNQCFLNGLTTHYLIDPNRGYVQVLEEQDASGSVQTSYVYGDDLLSQTHNNATHTYHYDGLGSTRALSDETGTVTDRYGYLAFGQLSYQTGSTPNDYLFTGEQYDNPLGFYYLRARYYNPHNGRFTQMDTFAGMAVEPPSLHKYLYANGDPVNRVDPDGYIAVSVSEVITVTNVASNLYTAATISINIFTGNYVVAGGQIAEEIVYAKLGALGRPVAKLGKRGIAVFYRAFGRNISLKLGRAASSAVLHQNLRAVGVSRPPLTAAHHIVAGKANKKARAILERFDIDINSPVNGVYLPRNELSPAIGALHGGGHLKAYHKEVLDRLEAAAASGDKIQVLNELGQIKMDLLTGVLRIQNKTR